MVSLNDPQGPIAAVTHPDPYPYYSRAVSQEPSLLQTDPKTWFVSGAEAVRQTLESDLCRVRPSGEPVPTGLLGSPAGEIFGRLIRMNDGSAHQAFKPAVGLALQSVSQDQAAQQAHRWARYLMAEMQPEVELERLADFTFGLPVFVLASLMGAPKNQLEAAARWTGEFVTAIGPHGSAGQVVAGQIAAGRLLELFHKLLENPPTGPEGNLLAKLEREAQAVGFAAPNRIVANGIGFLSQAYEATAGLIGNTLVALSTRPDLARQVRADLRLLEPLVWEVVRADPSVQNTRRYLARAGKVAGQAMEAGDMILVGLAAANRDPSANPNPERFDLFREDRQVFTFGAGRHACPGADLAVTIAVAGLEQLLTAGIVLDPGRIRWRYRPSLNTRVPMFEHA